MDLENKDDQWKDFRLRPIKVYLDVVREGLWRLGGRRKVPEGGGQGRRLRVEGSDKEDVVTFFEDTPQRMKTRVVGGDKGTNGFGFG